MTEECKSSKRIVKDAIIKKKKPKTLKPSQLFYKTKVKLKK